MAEVIRKSEAKIWGRLLNAFKTLNGQELKTGWFSTDQYESGVPVAYVATIHEFGAAKSGIPPRPFMRPTIEREENNWRRFIAQEAPKILEGTQTVEGLFEAMGLNISGEIARSISEVTEPALLAATILAKKRKMADTGTTGSLDKPLVESGLMLDTVSYTVGASTPVRHGSGGVT